MAIETDISREIPVEDTVVLGTIFNELITTNNIEEVTVADYLQWTRNRLDKEVGRDSKGWIPPIDRVSVRQAFLDWVRDETHLAIEKALHESPTDELHRTMRLKILQEVANRVTLLSFCWQRDTQPGYMSDDTRQLRDTLWTHIPPIVPLNARVVKISTVQLSNDMKTKLKASSFNLDVKKDELTFDLPDNSTREQAMYELWQVCRQCDAGHESIIQRVTFV